VAAVARTQQRRALLRRARCRSPPAERRLDSSSSSTGWIAKLLTPDRDARRPGASSVCDLRAEGKRRATWVCTSPTRSLVDRLHCHQGARPHDLLHGKRSASQPSPQAQAKEFDLPGLEIGLDQARFRWVWAAESSRCPNGSCGQSAQSGAPSRGVRSPPVSREDWSARIAHEPGHDNPLQKSR
jgi:hypothetical protein